MPTSSGPVKHPSGPAESHRRLPHLFFASRDDFNAYGASQKPPLQPFRFGGGIVWGWLAQRGDSMATAALILREISDAPYRGASARTSIGVGSSQPSVEHPAPDFIEDLGDEIATLAAHIHAATQRLLALIAECDELRGWERSGQPDCARWLAVRTGIDIHAAREKVRTARALAGLPLTSQAMGRGELSFSQVRALTRVATAENEADLLDLARGATAAHLERMVRAWKKGSRQDESERERERHASRTLSVFPDDEGMYMVSGRLDPEVGAALMRAIEAAGDALFRKSWVPGGAPESERAAAQRRADGIGLVAERALAAGFGRTEVDRTNETAPDSDADSSAAPISGTRAERYQVVLHVEPATLSEEGDPGRSELEDGTRVSAETSRRLSCDAGLVRVAHDADGSVLDVGRKTRTIPPALRRALEVRDRGCRFPGCGLRFADGHHVRHWADGGETRLDNCVLLCRHHHRLVHEGGWRVRWWGAGRPVFFDPRGGEHFEGRWEAPALPCDPVAALLSENVGQGVNPDGWTTSASWERERDIPDEVWSRAYEAF